MKPQTKPYEFKVGDWAILNELPDWYIPRMAEFIWLNGIYKITAIDSYERHCCLDFNVPADHYLYSRCTVFILMTRVSPIPQSIRDLPKKYIDKAIDLLRI